MKVSNDDLKKLLTAIDKTDDSIAKLEGKEAVASPHKPAPKTIKAKQKKVVAKKPAPKSTPVKTSK
jgi:hypothetical protein